MKNVLVLFVLVVTAILRHAEAQEPLFAVQKGDQVLFFVQLKDGVASKAYPKPSIDIADVVPEESGKVLSATRSVLLNEDTFYAVVANTATIRELDEKQMAVLKTLLLESDKPSLFARLQSEKQFVLDGWSGGALTLKWDELRLIPVSQEEIDKILSFEKALLGKWKFVSGEAVLGKFGSELKDAEPPLPFKHEVEFCADGKCILDGDQKRFYWIDGKFKRLSFQKDLDSKEYSQLEEFDIVQLDEKNLEIRSLAVPFAPSLQKISGTYPEPQNYKTYRFTLRE